jgi:hypothetical protein
MDQQGSGWTPSAADTRRSGSLGPSGSPGPWSQPQDDADPQDSAHTKPLPAVRVGGSGAHPTLGRGSGAHPILGHGSGAQRIPERGFPPARTPGREPAGTGSWSVPRPPTDENHEYSPASGYGPDGGYGPDSEYAADGGYDADGADDHGASGPVGSGHPDPVTRVDPQTVTVPAGGRRGAKAKTKRRLASRPGLLAGLVVVVVAAAGFGGYKLFYEPRVNAPVSPSLRLPTANAAPSSALNQSLGKWQHIGTRTQDPDPLTVTGLFPPQFELNGNSYLRTAAGVTSNCAQAVYGTKLQAALKSGHCTQVARATYLSGNGQMMGTVGVVNLDSVADASKAGQASGSQQIIAPLSAKTGPTKKLGNGTGVVQAEVKGHYLILMWAEFADLKSPSTSAATTSLEQFATNILTGSANINLSTRMLSGKA